MKKRILGILVLTIILSLNISDNIIFAADDNTKSPFQSGVQPESIKNQLSKIIKTPFNVELNDSTIVVSFPKVIKTTDEYLKDQLYVISNFLIRHKICPDTVIASWKNIDSNYAYKVAVTKEDLTSFRNGQIKLNELYSKMNLVKSETQKEDSTLAKTLEIPGKADETSKQELQKAILTPTEETKAISQDNIRQGPDNIEKPEKEVIKPIEEKKELSKEDETTKSEDNDTKEFSKLTITSAKEVTEEAGKPDLRPKIPPEGFYTPILKTVVHNEFNIKAENNIVTINIIGKPLCDEKSLRDYSYKVFNQVIRVNPSLEKISINWQPEEGAFGKSASIAGIYIKDYFRKKITQDELKEVILLDCIEPTSRHLNEITKCALIDVPIENLRKSKELREAANVYMQNSKLDSAIRTYKQAIKLNPNDFLSYYWLGEIYIKQSEFDDAKKALTKALSLNPDFRRADESLAKINSK